MVRFYAQIRLALTIVRMT